MAAAVRLLVAVVVVVLLARSARLAWRNRRLAVEVWRRIRPGHVAGAVALLVVVVTVAVGLTLAVPLTGLGLGSLVGLTGNAVFAPVEEVALRSGGASPIAGGEAGNALITVVTAAFVLLLVALFPWLAYIEERVFRDGLERAGFGRQLWTALRFGLLHLVMLIPLAAALAVAVAGFAYGVAYRTAYRRTLVSSATVAGPFGVALPAAAVVPGVARAEALLASTVWHTTFNSLIALAVLAGLLADTVA